MAKIDPCRSLRWTGQATLKEKTCQSTRGWEVCLCRRVFINPASGQNFLDGHNLTLTTNPGLLAAWFQGFLSGTRDVGNPGLRKLRLRLLDFWLGSLLVTNDDFTIS